MKKQPADKSYFFDKGYKDIARVMKTTWANAFKPVNNELHRLCKLFATNVFGAVFMAICDVVVFIPITLIIILVNSLFSVLFLISFLILAIIVYVLYTMVFICDGLFCLLKGISSSCPNCQNKFIHPSYKCPKCGRTHSQLRPSKYGIMYRRCLCGHKLPTTFFNGRQKLQAVCAKCNTLIKDGGKHIEITIPVIGGKSSGKTCFISMAIAGIEESAKQNGLEFQYSSSVQGDYYEINIAKLKRGVLPDKTFDERMMYYQFYLTPQKSKIKTLISFCDVAGETFEDNSKISEQIGYKYANAFIVLLDPLSIPLYRKEIQNQINLNEYGASSKSMDEVLSSLINTLENMYCISTKTIIKTDVAVVFTKSDLPGLNEKIGDKAVNSFLNGSKVSKYEAQNQLCEKFLIDYSESNFLNNLKSKFKSIQFFTCSALGHVVDGKGFAAVGVDEPALWIIDKASKAINLKEKWGKKI